MTYQEGSGVWVFAVLLGCFVVGEAVLEIRSVALHKNEEHKLGGMRAAPIVLTGSYLSTTTAAGALLVFPLTAGAADAGSSYVVLPWDESLRENSGKRYRIQPIACAMNEYVVTVAQGSDGSYDLTYADTSLSLVEDPYSIRTIHRVGAVSAVIAIVDNEFGNLATGGGFSFSEGETTAAIKLWHTYPGGGHILSGTLSGHTGEVTAIVVTDKVYMYSADTNGRLLFWRLSGVLSSITPYLLFSMNEAPFKDKVAPGTFITSMTVQTLEGVRYLILGTGSHSCEGSCAVLLFSLDSLGVWVVGGHDPKEAMQGDCKVHVQAMPMEMVGSVGCGASQVRVWNWNVVPAESGSAQSSPGVELYHLTADGLDDHYHFRLGVDAENGRVFATGTYDGIVEWEI